MKGINLLVSALAANKASRDKPTVGVAKPLAGDQPELGRRQAFQSILGFGAAALVAPSSSFALDMDAFMNQELANDLKNCDPKRDPKCIPKLTADEALCKYGQSGNARSEACKKVKAGGGELPSATKVKSLGGAYAM